LEGGSLGQREHPGAHQRSGAHQQQEGAPVRACVGAGSAGHRVGVWYLTTTRYNFSALNWGVQNGGAKTKKPLCGH